MICVTFIHHIDICCTVALKRVGQGQLCEKIYATRPKCILGNS